MEIFEPKNFFDFAELLTNVFTGAVAVVGLLIALKTFEIAKEAKDEWINQKKHEYEVTIKSKLKELIDTMYLIYDYNKNKTQVFINASTELKYQKGVYEDLRSLDKNVNIAIDYLSHRLYSKGKYEEKKDKLIEQLTQAVVGINKEDLNKVFYDIKDYIDEYEQKLKNLQQWVHYLKDAYLQSEKINDNDLHMFNIIFAFDLGTAHYSTKLDGLKFRVDQYLRKGAD